MSFLDLDEWLIELNQIADVVYSPIMDRKDYPENVDVCLVEGAVANEDNLEQILLVRRRTRLLVSFGDCAVTGNVTALRNPIGDANVILERSYLDPANLRPRIPNEHGIVPPLLEQVYPVHKVVLVDFHLPGCPPPAPRIRAFLEPLLAGQAPQLTGDNLRFG